MNYYDDIAGLINTLHQKSGGKNEKLRLLRILLGRNTYLSNLTRTLRTVSEIKQAFNQDGQNSSSYPTVAGEFLVNYMTDEYEDSLYSLNSEQKHELIQKIDTFLVD